MYTFTISAIGESRNRAFTLSINCVSNPSEWTQGDSRLFCFYLRGKIRLTTFQSHTYFLFAFLALEKELLL